MVSLSGTIANLNTYLEVLTNVQYMGATDVFGNDVDTISVSVTDGITVTDLGSISIDITGTDDPPSNTGTLPTGIVVLEDTPSYVDLSSVVLADPDGDTLTVTLSATSGTLNALSSGGVSVGGSGTGTITLVGTADQLNAFVAMPSSIQYTTPADVAGNDIDEISASVTDGTTTVSLGTINVDATNTEDSPGNSGTLPSYITAVEETPSDFDLSGLTLTDPDDDLLTVSLTSNGGTFNATGNGSVSVSGSNTTTLALTGSAGDLNAFLDIASGIQYTGANDASGNAADTVMVSVSDGGPAVNLGTIQVDITNTNDAPSNSGTLPSDLAVLEDTASNIDLSGLTLVDPDDDILTLSLTVNSGTWNAASGGGVTISGDGTTGLSLMGSAANLNAFLDVASNIQYTGPSNLHGDDAATFSVSLTDGVAPTAIGVVNLDITHTDDPPENSGSLPSDISAVEETLSNVDLSSINLFDPDGDVLTVTLTTNTGSLLATSGGGVTVTGSGTVSLTLTASAADLNTYFGIASNIQYLGITDLTGNDADLISVDVSDGILSVALGDINVDISNVPDAPTNQGTLQSTVTTVEDTESNLDLSGIDLADPDGDTLTLTLVAGAGTFTATSAGGVTVLGDSTGTITLTGSIGDLNSFLNAPMNLHYQGASHVFGTSVDSITVSVTDGTTPVVLGMIDVDITALTDAPANNGGLPTDVTVTEDVASNVDLSVTDFADPDGDLLTFSLTASSGILNASSSGGVTATGSGTMALTLVGTPTALNTYLEVASNIQYSGANNLFGDDADTLSATLTDGITLLALGSINVDITAVEDPPANSGTLPSNVVAMEDVASDVDLTDVTLVDPDGDSLTLTATAGLGTFTAATSAGVTISGDGTGALSLSGSAADLNAYLADESNIQYTGSSDLSGTAADSISVTVSDGMTPVLLGSIQVDITNTADAPTNIGSLPTDLSVTEDSPSDIDFSSIELADADGDTLSLELTATTGTFNGTTGGGVSVTGPGTSQLTLTGSASAINSFLDTPSNIQYTSVEDLTGDDVDTISVTVSDGTTTESIGTVNVDIANVNDAPENLGTLPSDIVAVEEIPANVDLRTVELSDADGDTLTFSVTAGSGTLNATSAGGVVVGGDGTAVLTLSGSATAINAFLDDATRIQYTGADDLSGDDADTLSIDVNDGSVSVALGSINVDITNTPDAPSNTGSLGATLNAMEDVATNFDLSGIELVDPDGDILTLSLTTTGGTLTASSGGGVVVSGSGSGSMTLSATVNDLNAYLDVATSISYTGPSNSFGDNIDLVAVSVTDGTTVVALGNVDVDITGVNDAPQISTNLSGSVNEGETFSLTTAVLDAEDPDDSGTGLTYSVTSGPVNGQLELSTSPSVAITSFTQADLESNLVVFRHDGSETTTASFEFSLADGGESGATPATGTFSIMVSPVNDDPSNDGSLVSDTNITEDVLSYVDLSGIDLSDADAGTNDLTITLTVSSGTLDATSSLGVTVSGSGTGVLSLVGTLSELNAFLDVSTSIGALSALDLNGDDAATLTIEVNDGGNTGSGGGTNVLFGTVNLDILPVNDDPTNDGVWVTDVTITEDVLSYVDLGGINLGDVDAGTSDLTVQLTASSGTLHAADALGVTVSGSGSSVLSLVGSLSELNAFLDVSTSIAALSSLNLNGDDAATITVIVNDGGNTGSGGGTDVLLGTVNLDILAVNDDPTNSGVLVADVTISEDILSNIDLSGIELSDIDAAGNDLTVTLTASSGTLQAVDALGVSVSGSGTDTLSLVGTLSELNAFLDVTTSIGVLSQLNLNGDDAATITVEVNDGGNTGSGGATDVLLGTINLDILPTNDDPTNAGVLVADVTITEDLLSDVDLSGIELSDVDAGSNDLTITLTASSGTLNATGALGVTVGGSGTGVLSLVGTLSELNAFLDVSTSIGALSLLNLNGEDAATITVEVNDGGHSGSGGGTNVLFGTVNLDILPVNDDPTNSGLLVADVTITEDLLSSVDLSGIDLSDVDADSNDLTMTLTASSGTLNAVSALGVTVSGSGTGTLTLFGTLSELNAFLDVSTSIGVLSALNLSGDDAATITVEVNDGGNTGSGGGTNVLFGTVNLDILAVNDDPTNTGVLFSDVAITEDILSYVDLSGIEINDVDAGTSDLTIKLTASSGTLNAASALGVTVTGSGTGVLSLVGTLSELNAFLDVSTSIGALSLLNLNGDDAATITVEVNDGGNTGSGGGTDVLVGTINLDILAVNDDPVNVGSLPSDLSVVVSVLTGLDLSGIDIVDVDAAGGLLTLGVSTGLSTLVSVGLGGITVGGSGTDAITITGTLDDINSFLESSTSIRLLPGVGVPGDNVDLLTITINDGGNSGSGGGSDVTLGTVNIDTVLSLPLMAAGLPESHLNWDITEEQLLQTIDAAILELTRSGLASDATLLHSTRFELADLAPNTLGRAAPDLNVVYIDRNGAGQGYFVDTTPHSNEEFYESNHGTWIANCGGPADSRYDLLTVVLHEMGHILGLEHEESIDDFMHEVLQPGIRYTI
ncbi:cadherin-like domain-containing protein [Bremerella sp. JC770]|uniref:cadherin-like domain-containing protein n=1 Tax=Bremerella sp. JC770 TaxID=3232137 RepID=UPI003457DAEE